MRKVVLLVVILAFFSCKEQKTEDIATTVSALDSQTKKEAYLLSIFQDDQKVRDDKKEHEILKRNNFDYQTQEYKAYLKKVHITDSLNFIKIKTYLERFGFPDFKPTNELALHAFNTVLMHQPTYEKQLQLFPYLYQGYKEGKIPKEKFSFLLNNMHRHKYGKSYPHAKTDEENIKQLLKKLELISKSR
ncbi:hypothetical protein [Aquimarina spongiae]|uniref:Uncharacterized protein n=1 Tax=Aquimarina spongiae TaxID=570521 RepID=A0A1M6JMG3_9FLAO|nr:hypothetical protein [Aquimarina spongiae]SHJ47862.1 hypothetical protein SAMN04488508_109144 [Aquimarina spongiae]